jgi:hypothetical protein
MSRKSLKKRINRKKRKTQKRYVTINLEICPHCKKSMRKHTDLCPYCASPITKEVHKCPYCKMYLHSKVKKSGGNSSCGAFGCPIAPLSWEQMNKIGGSVPGPFVGTAWQGNVSNWPGVNGISGDKNYLELNKYSPVDISRQMELNDTKIGGRRRHKKTKKYLKGGASIMKDDLVNLGRDVMYNFKSAYNTLNGYPAPVDPAPYRGHFEGSQRIIV